VFLLWVIKNQPEELLSETAFLHFGSMLSPEYKDAKAFLNQKSLGCPFKLERLSAVTVMEFIISLNKRWSSNRLCSI
jgi:hypothetical protein